jgi:two-component system, OmpR family, phosphate regulon response regulator PhoB
MSSQHQTIALLSANPAFGSILGRTINEAGYPRVALFSSLPALSTYLRIAPVDLAILSLDDTWARLVRVVDQLKNPLRCANPLLEVMVLTHSAPLVSSLSGTSVAAILTKPVSPGQLAAAIARALSPERTASKRRPMETLRAGPRQYRTVVNQVSGNVIPLFGTQRSQ